MVWGKAGPLNDFSHFALPTFPPFFPTQNLEVVKAYNSETYPASPEHCNSGREHKIKSYVRSDSCYRYAPYGRCIGLPCFLTEFQIYPQIPNPKYLVITYCPQTSTPMPSAKTHSIQLLGTRSLWVTSLTPNPKPFPLTQGLQCSSFLGLLWFLGKGF